MVDCSFCKREIVVPHYCTWLVESLGGDELATKKIVEILKSIKRNVWGMSPYYFDRERGMQRVRWFYLMVFRDSVNIRFGKYEIIIYKTWMYKIRLEVY